MKTYNAQEFLDLIARLPNTHVGNIQINEVEFKLSISIEGKPVLNKPTLSNTPRESPPKEDAKSNSFENVEPPEVPTTMTDKVKDDIVVELAGLNREEFKRATWPEKLILLLKHLKGERSAKEIAKYTWYLTDNIEKGDPPNKRVDTVRQYIQDLLPILDINNKTRPHYYTIKPGKSINDLPRK